MARKITPPQKLAKITPAQAKKLMPQVPGWSSAGGKLQRIFKFADYHEVMAFVNATAWISHHTNHHPDMEVGYNKVTMRYSTHDVGGLSDLDFICAEKINELLDGAPAL